MEKFFKKTETGEAFRELSDDERGKMTEATEKFEITRNIYKKSAFDSAEKILEEWLKLKEIKRFQKIYPQF